MRTYIANLLNQDAQLRALGLPLNAVYSANNTEDPDPTNPFIVQKWTDRESTWSQRRSPSGPNLLDLWVYDKRGDYTRIDNLIGRCHKLLDSVVAVNTGEGWITQIDWVGDGGDNYDDVWKAIVRTTSFRVIGSRFGG